MKIMMAKRQLCPTGAGIPIPSVARKELRLPDGDRFCAADGCMAWSWKEGHEQPYEERTVWYDRPHSELLRLATEAIDADEDPEVAQVIRDCQQKIHSYVLNQWVPSTPAGSGWRLIDKRWTDDHSVPHALFRRERIHREGYCGLVHPQPTDLNSKEAW